MGQRTLPGGCHPVVGVQLRGPGARVGEVRPRTLGLVPAWAACGTSGWRRPRSRLPRPAGPGLSAATYAVAAARHGGAARTVGPVRTAPRRAVLHRRRPAPAVGLSGPATADPASSQRRPTPSSRARCSPCAPSRPSSSAWSCCSRRISRGPSAETAGRSCSPRSRPRPAPGCWPSATCSRPRRSTCWPGPWSIRLVVATLQRDRPRLWLAVGLALGVGLENKHLVGVPRRRPRRRDRDHAAAAAPPAVPVGLGRCGDRAGAVAAQPGRGRPTTAGRSSSSPATSATSTARSAAPSSSSPSRC